MQYWRYKAYDLSGDIITGVIAGNKPEELVLHLMQSGLQVYDMITISRSTYERCSSLEKRLSRLYRFSGLVGRDKRNSEPIIDNQVDQNANLCRLRFRKASLFWWLFAFISLIILVVLIIINIRSLYRGS